MVHDLVCTNCGSGFTSIRPTAKICLGCRDEVRSKKQNASRAAFREELARKPKMLGINPKYLTRGNITRNQKSDSICNSSF